MHASALMPAVLLPVPSLAALLWSFTVIVSLIAAWRRPPVNALRLLADGRWRLTLSEGELDGVLVGWFAHPWLCLVRFRLGRYRRQTVVVPGWEVDADVHRRLRVALRSGDGAPSTSQA